MNESVNLVLARPVTGHCARQLKRRGRQETRAAEGSLFHRSDHTRKEKEIRKRVFHSLHASAFAYADPFGPLVAVVQRRISALVHQPNKSGGRLLPVDQMPSPSMASRKKRKNSTSFFLRIFNVSHSLEQPDKPVAQLSIQRTAGPERWTQPIFTRPPAQWEPRPTDIPPINRPTVVTCKYSPQSPLLRRVAAIFTPFRLGPFETAPYPPTPPSPHPLPRDVI